MPLERFKAPPCRISESVVVAPPPATLSVPAVSVVPPVKELLPVSVSMAGPVVVKPAVPVRNEPIVALALAVIVGDAPLNVIVPPLTVAVLSKVIPLAKIVPLTLGVSPPAVKSATFTGPLTGSHGVVPPLQLTLDMSHVAPPLPLHIKTSAVARWPPEIAATIPNKMANRI